jgi:hypothetical protein
MKEDRKAKRSGKLIKDWKVNKEKKEKAETISVSGSAPPG